MTSAPVTGMSSKTPLNDIIRSGAAAVVRLSHRFRQAEQSRIVVNAHRVNRGVVLVGSRRAVAIAVKNDKVEARFTGLAERLRSMTVE